MQIIEYVLIAVSVIYALVAVFLQRKLSNMDKMYELQDSIKVKSNELMELTKQGTSKEVLDAKQKEVMSMVSQSMRFQLKPMFVVFPLFLIVYYVALPAVFAPMVGTSTFDIFGFSLNYQTLFIAVTFVVGFGLSMTLMSLDKKRLKRAKDQAALSPQQ